MKTTFLHIADVHLDSIFAESDINKSAKRRSGLRTSFKKLIDCASEKGAAFVLIAGDLFDCEYVTDSTLDFINKIFSSHPEMIFIISPGNHDPYGKDSIYASSDFPDNVYIFKDEKIDRFDFDDIGVSVYGYAFTSPKMTASPIDGFRVEDESRINLLCVHGDLGKNDSEYCPISPDSLIKSGADYVALGHIHNGEGIVSNGGIWYGYCGCAEGRDYGECGEKGCFFVTLEKEGGEKEVRVEKITPGGHRYEKITADLSLTGSSEEAYSLILSLVQPYFEKDVSLKIILEGIVKTDMEISPTYIKEMIGEKLFSLELSDHTLPIKDENLLKNDRTLKGEFYRSLEADLKSDDAQTRETAAQALRLGLMAISGKLDKQ